MNRTCFGEFTKFTLGSVCHAHWLTMVEARTMATARRDNTVLDGRGNPQHALRSPGLGPTIYSHNAIESATVLAATTNAATSLRTARFKCETQVRQEPTYNFMFSVEPMGLCHQNTPFLLRFVMLM
eukprot:6214407-Pleurochrysis_carterae.AAC.4